MSKVVLLTGASSGIGKSTAELLLQKGFTVYGCARRLKNMEEMKELGLKPIKLDLGNVDSIKKCVKKVLKEEGRLDILINNAGYGSYGALEDVPMEEARRQFEVNLFGPGLLTKLVIPIMREQRNGKIINISSTGGIIATPFGGWYHASKFAIEGLSDVLRKDLRRFGIKVILIEPGAIKTEWSDIAMENLLKVSSETYKNAAENVAAVFKKNYKRATKPKVIARVIYRIIRLRRPRTRYVVGRGGKMIVWAKDLLTDKFFDFLILKLTKVK